MGHCLWLGPKPVSVQSLVDWEFVTFKIFAGNIDEMSVVTKKKNRAKSPLVGFPYTGPPMRPVASFLWL
jgi:hypothetical protein